MWENKPFAISFVQLERKLYFSSIRVVVSGHELKNQHRYWNIFVINSAIES